MSSAQRITTVTVAAVCCRVRGSPNLSDRFRQRRAGQSLISLIIIIEMSHPQSSDTQMCKVRVSGLIQTDKPSPTDPIASQKLYFCKSIKYHALPLCIGFVPSTHLYKS